MAPDASSFDLLWVLASNLSRSLLPLIYFNRNQMSERGRIVNYVIDMIFSHLVILNLTSKLFFLKRDKIYEKNISSRQCFKLMLQTLTTSIKHAIVLWNIFSFLLQSNTRSELDQWENSFRHFYFYSHCLACVLNNFYVPRFISRLSTSDENCCSN